MEKQPVYVHIDEENQGQEVINLEGERIFVSKESQRFVKEISDLPEHKYNKVMNLLENLRMQQETEAHLENKRGWRYMWQRTPKPYLLMLGYLVFLAPVGSLGYQNLSNVPDEIKLIYLIILLLILVLPLSIVFYLSYNYVKHNDKFKEIDEVDN
jgi:hypothetical protein